MIDCVKLYQKHEKLYEELVRFGSTYPMDKLLNMREELLAEYESIKEECSFLNREMMQRLLLKFKSLTK